MNFAEEKILKEKWSPESATTHFFTNFLITAFEFGHFEIDLIIGKLSKDEVLLTLDERMTRFRHKIAG